MLFSLLLGIAITCLPVAWVLHRSIPAGVPGRLCIIAGYGFLLGMVVVTLLMRLLDWMGISFTVLAIGLAMTPLLLLGTLLPHGAPVTSVLPAPALSIAGKILLLLCALLAVTHLVFVGVEVLNTPIFSWDSKQHWAKQAKVFLEHGALAPHVKNVEWLRLYGDGVYTNLHPDYPVTMPLIQTWVAMVMGEWHEIYVNLPWLLCFCAMGLVFFGQLRAAEVGNLIAGIATYMLFSLPLLNAQIALAGYADPFMGAAFLGAFAAFFNWSRSRQVWQAVLSIACAITCVLLKQEGTYWAIAFLPALLVMFAGIKRGYMIIFSAVAVVILLLLFLPKNTAFAGHTIREMHFFYRPESWMPLLEGFFILDNWHLLSYLVAIAVVWSTFSGHALREGFAPAFTVLAGALFLYLMLYLYTGYTVAAIQHTSNNRLLLHLMPALCFVGASVFAAMASTGSRVPENGQAD